MVFGEVLGLKIQDQLDAEHTTPATIATIDAQPAPIVERESFRMSGLYGEIPGSSCEPIRVGCWSTHE
jgi:hypothetical protein